MTKTFPESDRPTTLAPLPAVRRRYFSTIMLWVGGAMLLTILCFPAITIGRGLVMAAYLKQGEVAMEQGNMPEATRNYNTVMLWLSTQEDAYQERWNIALQTGDIETALTDFTAVVVEHPSASLPYCYRAQAHRELKDWDAALADYQRCLDNGANNIWIRRAPSAMARINRER